MATSANVGATLRVVVTATNAAGTVSATSAQTDEIAAVAPVNTVAPSISGTAVDGQPLTASHGTWTGTSGDLLHLPVAACDASGQGCADVDMEPSSVYHLTSEDVGSTIRLAVHAENLGGEADAVSAVTGVIAAADPRGRPSAARSRRSTGSPGTARR